jgi:hypothetical protein
MDAVHRPRESFRHGTAIRGHFGDTALRPTGPLCQREHSPSREATLCSMPEENAKVMVDNFANTFSQTGTFDPAAVASCGRVGHGRA